MLEKPLGSWSPVVLSSHCHPTIHPPSNIQGAATGLPESVGQGCLTAKMKQLKHTDFSAPWQRKWVFRFACVGKERGIPGAKKKSCLFVTGFGRLWFAQILDYKTNYIKFLVKYWIKGLRWIKLAESKGRCRNRDLKNVWLCDFTVMLVWLLWWW